MIVVWCCMVVINFIDKSEMIKWCGITECKGWSTLSHLYAVSSADIAAHFFKLFQQNLKFEFLQPYCPPPTEIHYTHPMDVLGNLLQREFDFHVEELKEPFYFRLMNFQFPITWSLMTVYRWLFYYSLFIILSHFYFCICYTCKPIPTLVIMW